MMKNRLERLPRAVAAALTVLVLTACEIRLRGDESELHPTASVNRELDGMTAKREQCRSISYEQKDALLECRKIWADDRRRFLSNRGAATPKDPDSGRSNGGSLIPVPPKDQSRFPSDHGAIQTQSE